MRKWIAIILAFLLLTSLVACTDENISGVPDQYLKMDVEAYVYEEDIKGDYTFIATHAWDKASAIDSVTITLEFAYEFGTESYVGNCHYRYDSAANNWTRIGSVRWGDVTEKLDERSYEKKHSGSDFDLQWKVDIGDLDLKNGTITCDIELMKSDGKVWRTDEFHTYPFDGSFEVNVSGVIYDVHLSVHGINIFRRW